MSCNFYAFVHRTSTLVAVSSDSIRMTFGMPVALVAGHEHNSQQSTGMGTV